MNIKTKYKIGDRVWVATLLNVRAFVIHSIQTYTHDIDDTGKNIPVVQYSSGGRAWYKESECYPSQAALLKEMQTKE